MARKPKDARGSEVVPPVGYADMLGGLKAQVRQAQFRAHRLGNEQLIEFYWTIGREILTEQDKQGWGSGVIARRAEVSVELDDPETGASADAWTPSREGPIPRV